MTEITGKSLPELAFARSEGTPTGQSIQFYDGYFPALGAGTYKITATQEVELASEKPKYATEQEFEVEGPRFTLDPALAETVYPPEAGNGEYDEELPFVVLADPVLPWERSIVPGGDAPTPDQPTPWLALAVFAEGEIEAQPQTGNTAATITVAKLLKGSGEVLAPQVEAKKLPAAVLQSHCQAITVDSAVFSGVMPRLEELSSLAHCRAVAGAGKAGALLSVVLANRLPQAGSSPRRFYAHLVSLEGFHDHLDTPPSQLPPKVRLASLLSWTFVSQPKSAVDFEALVKRLIERQSPLAKLGLPQPSPAPPEPAAKRIEEGYAPLALVSGDGESSFAWYRGPLTPVVPQPLPQVGTPPVAPREAASADALAIYLEAQGVFDLSYAAAWNAGRQVALADARFSEAMVRLRRKARAALGRLAQGARAPHLAGADPATLLSRSASRDRFLEHLGEGLASGWTEALAGARAGRSAPAAPPRAERPQRRAAVEPGALLERSEARDALGEHLGEAADPVAEWLRGLSLFEPLPFAHLVPNPAMLPPETLRFFYVDPAWIEALLAGATSIAMQGGADTALQAALAPQLAPPGPAPVSGLLIRSQLISAWPSLVVEAKADGVPLENLRDDRLAPSVRLCLFPGVPHEVTLSEPYRGLRFGIEEGTIAPRYVTDPGPIGEQIPHGEKVAPSFRSPPREAGGVIETGPLISALAKATSAKAGEFKAGDLAIQLISAPELQAFPFPPKGGRP